MRSALLLVSLALVLRSAITASVVVEDTLTAMGTEDAFLQATPVRSPPQSLASDSQLSRELNLGENDGSELEILLKGREGTLVKNPERQGDAHQK